MLRRKRKQITHCILDDGGKLGIGRLLIQLIDDENILPAKKNLSHISTPAARRNDCVQK